MIVLRMAMKPEAHLPQSWASFNMLGEFDYSDEKLQVGVLPPKKADRNHS